MTKLASISEETLRILEAGHYEVGGRRVDIGALQASALGRTSALSPEEIARAVSATSPVGTRRGRVSVTDESTTACARRLASEGVDASPLCLNFASARKPGGGFLGSALAQEETIRRQSGLYPTLLKHPEYYEANRSETDARYTDWMILSRDVPIFRDDRLALLDRAQKASFVTAPAPNAAALERIAPGELSSIFERRIRNVLWLGAREEQRAMVLGAWGCGAFRNDPRLVARAFRKVLDEGWNTHFDQVVFAILDAKRSDANHAVFADILRWA